MYGRQPEVGTQLVIWLSLRFTVRVQGFGVQGWCKGEGCKGFRASGLGCSPVGLKFGTRM